MKFNLHKLNRIAVVGLASVALIMPMAMNSNTSANASVNYFKKDPHLAAYGLINKKGQWIGPKHYQKMYDRGLLENDGVPNGAGDDVQTLADNAHISFWHAYRLWHQAEVKSHYTTDISDLDYKYGVSYHHKHARRHHARRHAKRSRRNRKHTSRKHNRKHRMNHRHAKKHGRKSRVSHRRHRYTYRWY